MEITPENLLFMHMLAGLFCGCLIAWVLTFS